MRLHLRITGHVQGVFFRDYVRKQAEALDLVGWVRNNADGSVEIVAEGDKASLKNLMSHCQKGPPRAEVKDVQVKWSKSQREFSAFEIYY